MPGTTNRFYVIYSTHPVQAFATLYYTKIQVNGTSATVYNNEQNVVISGSTNKYYEQAVIAVTTDNGGEAEFLYAAGSYRVDRYTITNSTITFSNQIYYYIGTFSYNAEMDISPDGRYLAVAEISGSNNPLKILTLDPCGNFSAITQYSLGIGSTYGVEFSDDSKKIYVSVSSGPNGRTKKQSRHLTQKKLFV